MSKEDAMHAYIQLINDLVESDSIQSNQVEEDLEEIIGELKDLYNEYRSDSSLKQSLGKEQEYERYSRNPHSSHLHLPLLFK